ncbi:MAG: DedA family protein [Planctomycetes bacterium]|nr:DedA family protein [Planctomycetota bacterium]
MMFLESSFFPFPSEIAMIPAGYLASQGRMDAALAFLAGLAGSLLGATFNYYVSLWVGLPLLRRYGKYFFFDERKLERCNRIFLRHGEITTFVCRLIPVVRQYISLPAGLARMNLFRFGLYTGLGAGIWVAILTAFGYWVGINLKDPNTPLAKLWNKLYYEYWKPNELKIYLVLAVPLALIIVLYAILQKRRLQKRRNAAKKPSSA